MSKILISVLAAVGVLSACSTNSGPTYTANEVNVAGQRDIYRMTCYGLFETQGACIAAAARICKDRDVVLNQTVDGLEGGQGRNDPREITFSCSAPPAPAEPVAQAAVSAPVPIPEARPTVSSRRVMLQGDTNFDTGSAMLTTDAKLELDKFLAANSGVHFTKTTISGYTDSTGSVAANRLLSQSRAVAVASYLKAHGLQSDDVAVHGFGSANPLASNSTAVGRAQNRRVEIQVDAAE